MKYEVLKDVIIDGVTYKKGKEVDVDAAKSARLVMLGYLGEPSATTNRAEGLDSETKPVTRKKSTKKTESKAE